MMDEVIEYADIKADTLYIVVGDVVVRTISPIPWVYCGPLKEKIGLGKVTSVARKRE